MNVKTVTFVASLVTATLTHPSAAHAEDRAECITAAEHGQVERQAGRFTSSRQDFLHCSAEACPRVVREDCQTWLSEVESAMPTVVFYASDDDGRDLVDVRVELDGKLLLERLDGRSVRVDPGKHALLFSRAGSGPQRVDHLFVQGERDRKIAVHLSGGTSSDVLSTPKQSTSRVPVAAIVSGSVAVAALATFAGFGLSAKSDLRGLDDSHCAPNCDKGKVDDIRTKMIVADVSLGVGILAAGLLTYFVVSAKSPVATSRQEFSPVIHF